MWEYYVNWLSADEDITGAQLRELHQAVHERIEAAGGTVSPAEKAAVAAGVDLYALATVYTPPDQAQPVRQDLWQALVEISPFYVRDFSSGSQHTWSTNGPFMPESTLWDAAADLLGDPGYTRPGDWQIRTASGWNIIRAMTMLLQWQRGINIVSAARYAKSGDPAATWSAAVDDFAGTAETGPLAPSGIAAAIFATWDRFDEEYDVSGHREEVTVAVPARFSSYALAFRLLWRVGDEHPGTTLNLNGYPTNIPDVSGASTQVPGTAYCPGAGAGNVAINVELAAYSAPEALDIFQPPAVPGVSGFRSAQVAKSSLVMIQPSWSFPPDSSVVQGAGVADILS